jgi:gluconate 2-dehydrogenase gamma chain
VVYYIDHLLSQAQGVSEPTYRSAPFAQAYDGDAPPAQSQGDYQTVWVARDELDRYGVQSPIAPSELYRLGLEALNNYARARFDGVFAALSAEQQDTLLAALEDGEAEGFDEPTGEDFFELVRQHTIQGMFCDPIYGGNRDMVGWQLIGYPGAQRGYSPFEMKTEGHNRAPSGLAQLHSYQPGHSDHPDAVFPVSGSQYFICTDEGLGQQE